MPPPDGTTFSTGGRRVCTGRCLKIERMVIVVCIIKCMAVCMHVGTSSRHRTMKWCFLATR